MYCVSLPGFTWQCGLKHTDIIIQTLQDKDLLLLKENNIRGGISSVMGDRYVKSDEKKKIFYIDANNLYGYAMTDYLPYKEIEMWHGHPDLYMNKLEDILNTPMIVILVIVEVKLKHTDNIEQKTKNFPFCPENKVSPQNKLTIHMNNIKPDVYTKSKKLICDWTDEKNHLNHYRMLKFYVRHGMVVDKIQEIISFRQKEWLVKFINFITQKKNLAENDFEKDFYELSN